MSRDVTATPVGQRAGTGRQQGSLRDYLNERVAPYLKKALIEGLNNDVEFPLQWLGEHLINLSILHEGNPDTTHIKASFKYNHDAPPPPPPAPAEIKSEEQPSEKTGMSNGVASDERQSEYVNGTSFPAANDAPSAAAEAAGAEELLPAITQAAAQEDTEMQGAT